MNDEELTKTIYEKINEALAVQRYGQQCLVRNFRLVKVILPSDVMKELRKQSSVVKMPSDKDIADYKMTFMSVPVEEDKYATRIRYVIEGDLMFYESR